MSGNLVAVKPPHMTTAQRNTLTPTNGSIIHNTDIGQNETYENGQWVRSVDQSFLSGTDTPSSYDREDGLMVVNNLRNGLTETSIYELARKSLLSERYFNQVVISGANVFFPLWEHEAPFKTVIADDFYTIDKTETGSPSEVIGASIAMPAASNVRGTNFGARTGVSYTTSNSFSTGVGSFSLSMLFVVPVSELGNDLTDRILIHFSSGEFIGIRNGKIVYSNGTYHYAPHDLSYDLAYTLVFVRHPDDTLTLTIGSYEVDLTGVTLSGNITALSLMGDSSGNSQLIGGAQGLAYWRRELLANEITNIYRSTVGLPFIEGQALGFSELTDGASYTQTDHGKAIGPNSDGSGLELFTLDFIPTNQQIEDGLHGYISGAVPNLAICAMQIQNKNLTLPVNAPKSKFYALTAPQANIVFDVLKYAHGSYGTEILIGTVTFLTGNNNGTLTLGTQTTFVPGDMLAIRSPNGVQGIRDLFLNLVGFSPIPVYT